MVIISTRQSGVCANILPKDVSQMLLVYTKSCTFDEFLCISKIQKSLSEKQLSQVQVAQMQPRPADPVIAHGQVDRSPPIVIVDHLGPLNKRESFGHDLLIALSFEHDVDSYYDHA